MILLFLSCTEVLNSSTSLRLQIPPRTHPLRLCLRSGAIGLSSSLWTLHPILRYQLFRLHPQIPLRVPSGARGSRSPLRSIRRRFFITSSVDPGLSHSLIIRMVRFLATRCLSLSMYLLATCSHSLLSYSVCFSTSLVGCLKNCFSAHGRKSLRIPNDLVSWISLSNCASNTSFLVAVV